MMEYYYSGTESLWCGNWNHLACRRWKFGVDHPSQSTEVNLGKKQKWCSLWCPWSQVQQDTSGPDNFRILGCLWTIHHRCTCKWDWTEMLNELSCESERGAGVLTALVSVVWICEVSCSLLAIWLISLVLFCWLDKSSLSARNSSMRCSILRILSASSVLACFSSFCLSAPPLLGCHGRTRFCFQEFLLQGLVGFLLQSPIQFFTLSVLIMTCVCRWNMGRAMVLHYKIPLGVGSRPIDKRKIQYKGSVPLMRAMQHVNNCLLFLGFPVHRWLFLRRLLWLDHLWRLQHLMLWRQYFWRRQYLLCEASATLVAAATLAVVVVSLVVAFMYV